ncbi:MAG: Ig-like domain-containing protein [Myxococcaceae bacterium]|nr:Ig-like domain-containing protein [Myxococcaceae bacterium]
MASRSLSLWFTLSALILGVAGCDCGGGDGPPMPPNPPAKDLPDANRSTVEVDRTASVSNGTDVVNITVTVVKADGVALADRTVTLTASGDGNTLNPSEGKTDAQGVLKATLTSTQAGTKQVTASVADASGAVVLSDKPEVVFSPPQPTQLAFSAQSLQATAGAPLSPALEVVIQDADGNRAYGSTGQVTLELAAGPAGGVLEGTVSATAVDGVALFSELVIKQAGTGYSLRATSGTLTVAVSPTFEVVPAAPSVLELTGLPANMTAGDMASVQVTLKDAFTNVATHYTGTVHFSSDDAQAVLPGDYAFTAADQGSKPFADVSLRTAGSRTLTVTDLGNAAVTDSASTMVDAASAAQLVFSVQPADGTVRTALASVSVALQDAYGNATAVASPQVTVGLLGGNPAAILSGTLSADPSAGVASFADLSIQQEGTGFQLEASAPGLTSATSATFTITDNLAPATAVISATPASATSVTVTWTAVGDDGSQGTATSYELRYATTPITTEGEFNAATLFSIPAPQLAGSLESAVVTGLDLSSTHYFALKVIDGAGNFSRSATVMVEPIQVGNLLISEFSALGSEFLELYNPTAAAIDVRGYKLRNAAGLEVDIRAPTDPNGTGSTPVLVPANGFLHGIPNPSGSVPAGVGFVYGAPGTAFALADTGDVVALASAAGTVEDRVDFRTFVSDPNSPLTADTFVGLAGSSSQLDAESLTATANDTATNWCVSFYPAGSKASRVTDTASAANASCKVAVINEVYFKSFGFDETNTFVEIAGPGGAVIGGAKIVDIEGKNPGAGTLNVSDGETNPGAVDGEFIFPAGTRIPADGILVIADTDPAGNTAVPNFVAGVDLKTRDMNLEDGPSESVQLVSAAGTLLDAMGYDPAGAVLDVAVASNGMATFEVATALGQGATNTSGTSHARATTSVDTDNNRNDFHLDPSPTPGLPNDTVNFTVTNLTPDDAPAANGVNVLTITGTDLAAGLRVQIGSGPQTPCTVNTNSTTATCNNIFGNAGGAVARVNATIINQAQVGVPNVVLTNGFTYTGKENETGSALEADLCSLQVPASFSVVRNQPTENIFGRILEAGVTEAPGAAAGIIAEVGYGTLNTNPSASNSWKFFSANYDVQAGNDDEYVGSFVAPNPAAATSYSYTFRFSQDNGLRWTYCDLNGAGSNAGADFETTQLGVMSVTLQ